MAEFGEQLKKAREAKGITQQSLADKMYVSINFHGCSFPTSRRICGFR